MCANYWNCPKSTRKVSETEHDLPFAEFIDDYFAECDEHLSVARKSLLGLESSVGRKSLDRSLLADLFRSFHSIKGLSAMVGVKEAEHLAHQMESYLSALTKDQVALTVDGLDALIRGVQTLEQVIAARRAQTQAPSFGPLLTALHGLVPKDASADQPSRTSERAPAPSAPAGTRVWQFMFVPSAELAELGINVNTIRQRLQEVGELIRATPVMLAEGQIAFSFLVATSLEEAAFLPWEADGLTFAPHEVEATGQVSEENSEEPPAPGNGHVSSLMHSNVVRVDLARLDELMRMIGELVISRARLDDNLKRLAATLSVAELRTLQETNQALERQLRDLREGVMRVRLVPVREIFARMQFVVRDLTREVGKKVTLSLSGQETEIDKFVVERMMDPLLHLVRNAVSHGLEKPEERLARGKPAEGTIALRAGTSGETIRIEVEDDGRGIDADKVFARARETGLRDRTTLDDSAGLLDLICAPGFSTREEADRASGRGVGMAVVRSAVEELGGTLTLSTRPGQGTCFTIQLPLTLAIADALIVTVAGQTFAVPQVAVREVIQVNANAVKTIENNELVAHRDAALPLIRLGAFFGLTESVHQSFHVLIVGAGLAAVGIAVERILGLREIVVRPLTDPLIRVPGIGGATELGDGRAVLILDALPLTRAARKQPRGEKPRTRRSGPEPLVAASRS